ncbi:MAG: hypothetical protein JJ863_10350 [Deltaproteobacteria bacterium]|nr:hypothetical protein [Deltaproteobacteria bacterium]
MNAMDCRLILLEGPVGAGKSTTGELLAERLSARGQAAEYWFGFAPDHPITTRCERFARQVFGGDEDAAPPALDPGDEQVFTAPQWARFAERLAVGDAVAIVEGKYFQQCLEYPYLLGASVDEVRSIQQAIVGAMAPATPRLIAFEVSDPAAHRAAVCSERPPHWPATLGGFFARHPWNRAGLEGADAFHAFYDEWAPIEAELIGSHPGPTLRLLDAQRDRDAAWDAIDAFLG